MAESDKPTKDIGHDGPSTEKAPSRKRKRPGSAASSGKTARRGTRRSPATGTTRAGKRRAAQAGATSAGAPSPRAAESAPPTTARTGPVPPPPPVGPAPPGPHYSPGEPHDEGRGPVAVLALWLPLLVVGLLVVVFARGHGGKKPVAAGDRTSAAVSPSSGGGTAPVPLAPSGALDEHALTGQTAASRSQALNQAFAVSGGGAPRPVYDSAPAGAVGAVARSGMAARPRQPGPAGASGAQAARQVAAGGQAGAAETPPPGGGVWGPGMYAGPAAGPPAGAAGRGTPARPGTMTRGWNTAATGALGYDPSNPWAPESPGAAMAQAVPPPPPAAWMPPAGPYTDLSAGTAAPAYPPSGYGSAPPGGYYGAAPYGAYGYGAYGYGAASGASGSPGN